MIEPDPALRSHLAENLLACDDRTPEETRRLAELVALLVTLPPPPDPGGHFPGYAALRTRLIDKLECHADAETIEEAFLALYEHLHMIEAPYSPAERRRLDETHGYWCHAGGLAPILKAGPWIRPWTISADYGSGNGLQCLLLQCLDPHECTVQIEISREMVEIGQRLQTWLGIGDDRVRWLVDDIHNVPPTGMDFIYLYRPVRPEGLGLRLYRSMADTLEASKNEVIIFSVADCLRDHLSTSFHVFYCDGHLTCFRGPAGMPARSPADTLP
jgi:hypothetical protein